jgi:uncharacterized protein
MNDIYTSDRARKWVGSLTLGPSHECICIQLDAGQPNLDRPDYFQFQIPLHDLEHTASALRFRAGQLQFTGRIAGDQCSGTATDGAVQGTFTCYAVQEPAPGRYAQLLGIYYLAPDRPIMLSQDVRPEGPLYFYVDGEQIVRLHPLAAGQFFSERCETITAQLDQQGQATGLRWQALDQPPLDAPRGTPWQEEALRIPIGDYLLAGTLMLPLAAGPHPAVVLCHLANTHQRDYYRLYAAPFVQHGIAAFIYDKRGSGESTGTPLFSEIFELADDATAVVRALQGHPALRAGAIGLWGMSNGAWVAPLAADRVGNAAFVIGASVAGVSPARQEQFRRANVAHALGASPGAVALIERLWEQFFRFAIDGQWNDQLEATLLEVYTDQELQRLPPHPEHSPHLQPVPPRALIADIRANKGGTWPAGGFDPAPVYARLACPIFCIWGQDDTVLPVEEGMQRLEHALAEHKHPSYHLQIVPHATHLLYLSAPAVHGMLDETMHTQLHNVSIAPGVREAMAIWAAQLR